MLILAESQSNSNTQDNFSVKPDPTKLSNSEALGDLDNKFYHLDLVQHADLTAVIWEFNDLYPDVPGRAHGMLHDVDVGDAGPINLHPCRLSPQKREIMRKETDMLENNIVQPCTGNWSSPLLACA